MYADCAPAAVDSLLLFRGGGLLSMIDTADLVPWLSLAVSGIAVPLILTFRHESREDRSVLHKALNDIRSEVAEVRTGIAVLNERDRITEILDKRLPRD